MSRPPIGERAMTAAEKQARYRQRKAAAQPAKPVAEPCAECERLKAELSDARHALLALRAKLAARAAKPEKPPLLPDEQRDRLIKAQATTIRNLRTKLRHLEQHYEARVAGNGDMGFKTVSLLSRVLHPDSRGNVSEADFDEACRAFNAWKADRNRAQRQGR